MNRRLHRLLSTLATVCLVAFAASGKVFNEKFVPDQKIYDFGTILEEKGKVSHTFTITNHSDEPLSILYSKCGCSCTTTELPVDPVKPGKTCKVTVTFDPRYRPGHFSKEVSLLLSDDSYIRLWVKGDVTEMKHPVSEKYRYDYGDDLWMNFETVNFGSIAPGQTKTMDVKFCNNSRRVMRLSFVPEEELPGLIIPCSAILQPGEEGEITFRMTGSDRLTARRTITVIPTIGGVPVAKKMRINVVPASAK